MNEIEIGEVIDLEDEQVWTVTETSDYGVKLRSEDDAEIEYSWEEMGL